MLEKWKGMLTIIFYKIKTAAILNYAKISATLIPSFLFSIFPTLSFFPSLPHFFLPFQTFLLWKLSNLFKRKELDQYNELTYTLPSYNFYQYLNNLFHIHQSHLQHPIPIILQQTPDYITSSVNIYFEHSFG